MTKWKKKITKGTGKQYASLSYPGYMVLFKFTAEKAHKVKMHLKKWYKCCWYTIPRLITNSGGTWPSSTTEFWGGQFKPSRICLVFYDASLGKKKRFW